MPRLQLRRPTLGCGVWVMARDSADASRLPDVCGAAKFRAQGRRRGNVGLNPLWSEIKRRRVPQALIGYSALCLAVWGGAEVAAEAFDAPAWILRAVIIASALGLPVVLGGAWALRLDSENQSGRAWAPKAAVFIGGLLALSVAYLLAHTTISAPATSERESRVIVLPFDNLTGDESLGYLGAVASDWITQGLQGSGFSGVVPTPTALAVSQYLQRAQDSALVVDPIRTAEEETGATLVVTGTYQTDGDSIRFVTQIVRPGKGGLSTSVEPVAAPRSLPTQALAALRERITGAVALVSDEHMAPVAAAQPPPDPGSLPGLCARHGTLHATREPGGVAVLRKRLSFRHDVPRRQVLCRGAVYKHGPECRR